VFILGELADSAFAIFYFAWSYGMASMNSVPLDVIYVASFIMMFMPSVYLLNLIFIAFIQMRYLGIPRWQSFLCSY